MKFFELKLLLHILLYKNIQMIDFEISEEKKKEF